MMAEPVKAADLAPSAFSSNEQSELDRAEDVEFDLKHLACFDSHPIDPAVLSKKKKAIEVHLQELASKNVHHLISRLFNLPTESSNVGPLAQLPPPTTVIPREKPVPTQKAQTKWEKFAEEKGIKNKKRDRLVWDENFQEWRPRYGYKRAGDQGPNVPWIELKPGQENSEDPFADMRASKKAKVAKNMLQQIRNKQKSDEVNGVVKPKAGIPVDLINTSQGAAGAGKKPMQRGKKNTLGALSMVQQSTASMGKFDEKRESEPERRVTGKRRKFKANIEKGGQQAEKEGYLKLLNQVMISKGKSKQDSKKQSASDLAYYDAIEGDDKDYRKKKGRAGAGKATKITKKRAK